jgi:hypothetical protein
MASGVRVRGATHPFPPPPSELIIVIRICVSNNAAERALREGKRGQARDEN